MKKFKKQLETTFDSFFHKQKDYMESLVRMQLKHKELKKFEGIHNNKDIVVVASGPTSKDYTPIKNVIHIGVNRSFMLTNIEFDYLVIQDYHYLDNSQGLIDEYRTDKCIKFYGILPTHIIRRTSSMLKRIPRESIIKAQAIEYILDEYRDNKYAEDISCEFIGDWRGTIFSTLQIALYMNPKNIYLVGCDCSNEKSINSPNNIDYTFQKNSWLKFKEFVNNTYPNTKIISINPVGLKGLLHKDLYLNPYKKD